MTKRLHLFFVFLMHCGLIWAQQTPVPLDEVTVSDAQLRKFSASASLKIANDSVISRNQTTLTSLLQFNSLIYFKENGLGMVASPSFRGTTAQQTAVVWNGINLNSQFNGQTDFNTILPYGADEVTVRSGGGSVMYGSGAVGGTIHLNNLIQFGKGFRNTFRMGYGSFNTANFFYKGQASGEGWSASVAVNRSSSDNDYKGTDGKKNQNGQYENYGVDAVFGYKINQRQYLKLYSNLFDGDRHFSLVNPEDTRTKYRDLNHRNLLEWSFADQHFTSKLRAAYLSESYRYYGNLSSPDYTFGKARTAIGTYDAAYSFTETLYVNAIVSYQHTRGEGSDIENQLREILSGAWLIRQKISSRLSYEAGIRKEITANYQSPLLFSAGTIFKVSEKYTIKGNFSHNFRIPTFNDLYWTGAGHADLKPESAYQGEVGQELRLGSFKATVNVYHSRISDMIRWVPGGGGWFRPENVDKVRISGAELLLEGSKRLGKNSLQVSAGYAYTRSENADTGKQLMYVPYHKATVSAGFHRGGFSAVWQSVFTGSVFLQTDNDDSRKVRSYALTNLLLDYTFGKKHTLTGGIHLYNLWNEAYESVNARPMPGRYFTLHLTLIL